MAFREALRKMWDDMLTHVMNPNAASGPSSDHSNRGSQQMFGDSNFIQGGHFTIVNGVGVATAERAGFKILQQNVAPSAFHNSAQRVDPPRCHPETRLEILESILHWITQSEHREHWLLWLNGAAGAGKSAIMQTIAERCVLTAIAIASFFFMRSDARRNTMVYLVGTLVYQLIRAIPSTVDEILSTIENDPLIFQKSLETQLQQLIVHPLLHVPFTLRLPFVVLIDGLDECLNRSHQSNLIEVLGNICSDKDIPIIFLIASRREIQIMSQFESKRLINVVEIVPLDDSEASDDIRRFLNAKFTNIRGNHPFRHLLPPDWPSTSIVSEIVDKASGQFIFASVVINFVSSDRANPVEQLKVIRDLRLRDPSCEHPFAHLDSLYQHIFSQVKSLDKVLDILAFYIITSTSYIMDLEGPFLLESGNLEVLLVDLLPILQLQRAHSGDLEIRFLHNSLSDFLQDQLRSHEYFLDLNTYCTKLLCMFLERPLLDPLSPAHDWNNIADQEYWRLEAMKQLFKQVKASNRLQNAVMCFNSTFHCIKIDERGMNTFNRVRILASLKNLNFGDQGKAYQHVLNIFAEGHAKFWPFHSYIVKELLRDSPDICARICQLRPDLARRPSLDLSEEGEKSRRWLSL